MPQFPWPRRLYPLTLLMLAGCGGGSGEDDAQPPPPPITGTATGMWTPPDSNVDGSPLLGLAGYRIYYGTEADVLEEQIDLDNPGLTSHTFEDLPAGTWYFAVTAYSTEDTESVLSALASKTIN